MHFCCIVAFSAIFHGDLKRPHAPGQPRCETLPHHTTHRVLRGRVPTRTAVTVGQAGCLLEGLRPEIGTVCSWEATAPRPLRSVKRNNAVSIVAAVSVVSVVAVLSTSHLPTAPLLVRLTKSRFLFFITHRRNRPHKKRMEHQINQHCWSSTFPSPATPHGTP